MSATILDVVKDQPEHTLRPVPWNRSVLGHIESLAKLWTSVDCRFAAIKGVLTVLDDLTVFAWELKDAKGANPKSTERAGYWLGLVFKDLDLARQATKGNKLASIWWLGSAAERLLDTDSELLLGAAVEPERATMAERRICASLSTAVSQAALLSHFVLKHANVPPIRLPKARPLHK